MLLFVVLASAACACEYSFVCDASGPLLSRGNSKIKRLGTVGIYDGKFRANCTSSGSSRMVQRRMALRKSNVDRTLCRAVPFTVTRCSYFEIFLGAS